MPIVLVISFFFSDAEMNVGFNDRLATLLDTWIFEASIAFGVGNLRRLLMPVVVFEKTSPNLVVQPEKLVDKSRKSERIILSLNYTMNGKNQFICIQYTFLRFLGFGHYLREW